MYLTYAEYIEMGGNLDVNTFADFAFSAQSIIDQYTYSRLVKVDISQQPERTQVNVKRCMYKIIQFLQLEDSSSGMTSTGINPAVASESNDGVSVSYAVMGAAETVANSKQRIRETIRTLLGDCLNSEGRKLLYKGLYPNE